MKARSGSRSCVASIALSLLLAGPAVSQTVDDSVIEQANIVFIGSVIEKGAVALATLSPSERTLIVQVEEVVYKPAAVSLFEGDTITVQVRQPAGFEVGTRATFYTDGWVFGSGLAVRELGHEVAPATSMSAAGRGTQDVEAMHQELSEAKLRARLQAADVVVVGRVTEVRPAEEDLGFRATQPPFISEHNPDWQEAIIAVESSIRGSEVGEEIVVRFPGSTDVAWRDTPRFRVGDEGTFLLQADSMGGPRALIRGIEVGAYTADSKVDVLPRNAADRIRELMSRG